MNYRVKILRKALARLNLIKIGSKEEGAESLKTLLERVRGDLARIAQETYDEWEQDEEGWSDSFNEIGVGGICHIISDRIVSFLNSVGVSSEVNACSVSDPFVQHVYVIAWQGSRRELDPEEEVEEGEEMEYSIYSVDVPYWVYEEGGGFTWRKLPDIKFGEGDVSIEVVEHNASSERLSEIIDAF